MTVVDSKTTELFFPEGLLGWEEWKHFWLECREESAPVMLLHSLDWPELSFVVADPLIWYPDYEVDLTPEELLKLRADRDQDLNLLAIMLVEKNPFAVTANLLGPIVVNLASGLALQVIQSGRSYSARHPIKLRSRPIKFEKGLIEHPEQKNFLLQENSEIQPVKLLVSQDFPGLSYPVIFPWIVESDYAPNLDQDERQALGVRDLTEVEWLVILDMHRDPLLLTANLYRPLAYNRATGIGLQTVLSHSDYSIDKIVAGNYGQAFTIFQTACPEI